MESRDFVDLDWCLDLVESDSGDEEFEQDFEVDEQDGWSGFFIAQFGTAFCKSKCLSWVDELGRADGV